MAKILKRPGSNIEAGLWVIKIECSTDASAIAAMYGSANW
jgi:hypothetical protein